MSAVVVSEGEVGRPKRKMRRNLSRVLRQKLTRRRSEASFHPPSSESKQTERRGDWTEGSLAEEWG